MAWAGPQPVYDEYKGLVALDRGRLRKRVPGMAFFANKIQPW